MTPAVGAELDRQHIWRCAQCIERWIERAKRGRR